MSKYRLDPLQVLSSGTLMIIINVEIEPIEVKWTIPRVGQN